jgi:starch synthase
VLFGNGDRLLEERFELAARRHPGRIAVRIGYKEPVAHRVVAGGDILLHPARFEPCGLTQLYAMRYGALPVVRRTGGLCDTVVDTDERSVVPDTATGFAFESANSVDMLHCIERALALYRQPLAWRKMQRQAMAQEFGWSESARRYLALYRDLAPQAAGISEAVTAEPIIEKAAG